MCFCDCSRSPYRWLVLDHVFTCQNVACCFSICPTPLVLLQHTSATPTATARMDYPLHSYTRTCTDHPPHRGSHESGLDSGSGGMVQPAQLMATAGGRDASSASCPSTMTTPVDTFASGVTLTPDDVDINEQGNAILPADFYQEKFRKKVTNLPNMLRRNSSSRHTTSFLFLTKNSTITAVEQYFFPGELWHPMINNNLDKWKRCYDKVLTLGGLFLPRG